MANRITEECNECGACEPECPNEAITAGDGRYVIDADKCDECAAHGGEPKCMAACTSDAIVKV